MNNSWITNGKQKAVVSNMNTFRSTWKRDDPKYIILILLGLVVLARILFGVSDKLEGNAKTIVYIIILQIVKLMISIEILSFYRNSYDLYLYKFELFTIDFFNI